MTQYTGLAKIITDHRDRSSLFGFFIGDIDVINNEGMNNKEIIPVAPETGLVKIEHTTQRQNLFGAALNIQVELRMDNAIATMYITSMPVKVYVGPNSLMIYELDFTGQGAMGRIIVS